MWYNQWGERGSIFIDPACQGKGYGRRLMLAVEGVYPKVKRWKLEVLSDVPPHRFYKPLGYRKAGRRLDRKSGLLAFVYEKTVPR